MGVSDTPILGSTLNESNGQSPLFFLLASWGILTPCANNRGTDFGRRSPGVYVKIKEANRADEGEVPLAFCPAFKVSGSASPADNPCRDIFFVGNGNQGEVSIYGSVVRMVGLKPLAGSTAASKYGTI